MKEKKMGIFNCNEIAGNSGNMSRILDILQNTEPEAYAQIYGKTKAECICGRVQFYALWGGTLAAAEVTGLPAGNGACRARFFGFHIHEGSTCAGTGAEPFAKTGEHYNPQKCAHPFHAGDMPALLGNNGYAVLIFFTDRFVPEELIGRTAVIHEMPDDYKTQPSGAAGEKIACGEIKEYKFNR